MKIIGTTFTKGYKPAIFHNSPIHSFFENLQAVLRSIDKTGGLDHLFAKPYFEGGDLSQASEIKWMSELSGEPSSFSQLPKPTQKVVGEALARSLEGIREYGRSFEDSSGLEKQYADFLKAISISPEMQHVIVINEKIPVLVHWGFIREETNPNLALFVGWTDMIAQLKPKSPDAEKKPAIQGETNPVNEKKNAAQPEPEKKAPTSEQTPKESLEKQPPSKEKVPPIQPEPTPVKKRSSTKKYGWVKWLAILLAIIIVLLLLLRKLRPPPLVIPSNKQPSQPSLTGGNSSGQPPSSLVGAGGGGSGGGGGGSGSGGAGSAGSAGSGAGGSGSGSGGSGSNSGAGAGNGGASGGQQGGFPSAQPSNGVGGGNASSPNSVAPSSNASQSAQTPKHPKVPIKKTTQPKVSNPNQNHQTKKPPVPKTPPAQPLLISLEVVGTKDQTLISSPPDPGTQWKLVPDKGGAFDPALAYFLNSGQRNQARGPKVTLHLIPASKEYSVKVVAKGTTGIQTTYHFKVKSGKSEP
ncbi:hypothetical protein HYY75_04900 [bacterium]|nr:hypothetical protein [bacterium]